MSEFVCLWAHFGLRHVESHPHTGGIPEPQVQAAVESALGPLGGGWTGACPVRNIAVWVYPGCSSCMEATGQYSQGKGEEGKTDRINSTTFSLCLIHTGGTASSACTRFVKCGGPAWHVLCLEGSWGRKASASWGGTAQP